MTDAISAALWDVSGTRMYARNAFRLTELPTDAGRQDTLHGRQRVVTMRQVDPDLASPEVLAAFDVILGDPRRRLVDEVFWLWDTPDADCGCTGSLHSDHDAAVRAHSAVLDQENERPEPSVAEAATRQRLWELASGHWEQLLRRAAFWDHIRHRIAALNERQLDDSVIETLRQTLPLVLVKPLVQLAVAAPAGQSWRAELAREWPAPKHTVDDQLEEAAGSLYETVVQATTAARRLVDERKPYEAAALIDKQTTNLTRLDELVPPDRHRRTATVRNAAGVVYNNCGNALLEAEGTHAASQCEAWFVRAHALASDPQTIRTIEQNDSALDDLVDEIGKLERKINDLVRSGRGRQARAILLDLRRRLPAGAETADIDRMLAGLGATPPTGRGPAPVTIPGPGYGRSGSGAGRKPLVFTVVVTALVLIIAWFWPEGASAESVSEDRRADNAAPGTCIATEQGWREDKSAVPVIECGKEHWGEVLGYPLLGETPSPYPGDAQTAALARFHCGLVFARQHMPEEITRTAIHWPDQSDWNGGGQSGENYAACVVYRVRNEPMPPWQHYDPERSSDDASVDMSLSAPELSQRAPVGSCILSWTRMHGMNRWSSEVPVAACDRSHWGEVLGYPVLSESDAAPLEWQAISDKAERVCQESADSRNLPSDIRTSAGWAEIEGASGTRVHAICVAHRKDDAAFRGGLV